MYTDIHVRVRYEHFSGTQYGRPADTKKKHVQVRFGHCRHLTTQRRSETKETKRLTEWNEEFQVEQCKLDEVTQHQRQHHDKRTWRHTAVHTYAHTHTHEHTGYHIARARCVR